MLLAAISTRDDEFCDTVLILVASSEQIDKSE